MLELVLVFYWCTKVYNAQPWWVQLEDKINKFGTFDFLI